MARIIDERRPRSRGRVRCSACTAVIPAGHQYRRATVVDGGDLWHWLSCEACEQIVQWLPDLWPYGDEGYTRTDYEEWAVVEAREHGPHETEACAWLTRAGVCVDSDTVA